MCRTESRSTFAFLTLAAAICSICTGCAVPVYDVPLDEYGQPTVRTIVERIQCEIRDMVRDDRPGDPASFHRLFLLNEDYDVTVALSVDVNNAGGLSPSVTYVNPLSLATAFTFAANATVSEARDHTFTENLQLSTRQIYSDWKSGIAAYECPRADTNLAGTLGLKDLVSMAVSAPAIDENLKSGQKSVFGGTVQFVVTKSLSATGPSWQLVRFKNVSALANLSQINTDKITLAFAPGRDRGKRIARVNGFNPTGYQFIQQQLLNSINTQLIIQNVQR
jgi:hypothetical protein